MYSSVKLNTFGYYELRNIPNSEELKHYYQKEYYQSNQGNYHQNYSQKEIIHINNKIHQKHLIVKDIVCNFKFKSILDIGCGEGYTLKYYNDLNWGVLGLDFSSSGLINHNPNLIKKFVQGDIKDYLKKIQCKKQFDIVIMNNVLEHLTDPHEILQLLDKLTHDDSVLIIEVPNDFSIIQEKVFQMNKIQETFWVKIPDHIQYFNKEGLLALCYENGWSSKKTISDFPIDFALFNNNTNYIRNPHKGKSVHEQRLEIDNLLNSISITKTIDLYEILSDMVLGRQIIYFLRKYK